jgi:hypothetical protein
MSKRLKNYPDPNLVMEEDGADALRSVDTATLLGGGDAAVPRCVFDVVCVRVSVCVCLCICLTGGNACCRLYLITSPAVRAENLRFERKGVQVSCPLLLCRRASCALLSVL